MQTTSMTQVSSDPFSDVKRAYGPNEMGKRDPHGATFVAEAARQTDPDLFPNIGGTDSFLDGMFGHKTGRKCLVNLR